MIGAILGDIIGSFYEFRKMKEKDFELLNPEKNFFTDDTLMTIAISNAVLKAGKDFDQLETLAKESMLYIGRKYPSGYGSMFRDWLKSDDPQPYNSFGNGAAMRVSACGICYDTLDDVKACAHTVTKVTHNHPEGMKAAEATAVAIYLLKNGASKYELRKAIQPYYNLYRNLEEIRPRYYFTEDARYTVPQAIMAFLESTDYEDAIRNAVSLGGDADTLAAITGSLAEAYYGIPMSLYAQVEPYIYEDELIEYIEAFKKLYPVNVTSDVFYDEPLIFRRNR